MTKETAVFGIVFVLISAAIWWAFDTTDQLQRNRADEHRQYLIDNPDPDRCDQLKAGTLREMDQGLIICRRRWSGGFTWESP